MPQGWTRLAGKWIDTTRFLTFAGAAPTIGAACRAGATSHLVPPGDPSIAGRQWIEEAAVTPAGAWPGRRFGHAQTANSAPWVSLNVDPAVCACPKRRPAMLVPPPSRRTLWRGIKAGYSGLQVSCPRCHSCGWRKLRRRRRRRQGPLDELSRAPGDYLVPVSPSVNPMVVVQPEADPAPCAVSVLPLSVTFTDWKVMVTAEQLVNWTGGHTRLPCQEADLPLPCMVTEPLPSRHTLAMVASWPDTVRVRSPANVCGEAPCKVSVAVPLQVPPMAASRLPPLLPPQAAVAAIRKARTLRMCSPLGGIMLRAGGDVQPSRRRSSARRGRSGARSRRPSGRSLLPPPRPACTW